MFGDPVDFVDPTGTFGLIGAAGSVGFELILQLVLERRSLACLDYGDLVAAGIAGAIFPTFFQSAAKFNRSARLLNAYSTRLARTAWSPARAHAVQRVGQLWKESLDILRIDIPVAAAAGFGLRWAFPEPADDPAPPQS